MAAVAAPFAYYATLVSSGIFGLTALPQLFKPWEFGVALYLPFKLPQDTITQKQMTVMSFMFAVCILFLCVSNVIVAMSNLTKPFVMVNMAFFALQIGTFIPKSSGEAAADYGFDTKMIFPQIGMMGIFLCLLGYSLFTEDLAMAFLPELTLQAKILIFFNGFNIFANCGGIAIPETFWEMYAPGYPPKDRYAKAQLALFLQGLSIFNTIVPAVGIVYLMTTEDYALFLACTLPFYFVFTGVFIYFLATASEQGWDPRAMYFWLSWNNLVTGASIMILLDAYGLLA